MQNYKKIGALKIANQINLLFKRRSSKNMAISNTFDKHFIII